MRTSVLTIAPSSSIKAKNRAGLLALIGLHNTENTSMWRDHIEKMVWPCDKESLPAPYERLKEHVNQEIFSISDGSIKTSP